MKPKIGDIYEDPNPGTCWMYDGFGDPDGTTKGIVLGFTNGQIKVFPLKSDCKNCRMFTCIGKNVVIGNLKKFKD